MTILTHLKKLAVVLLGFSALSINPIHFFHNHQLCDGFLPPNSMYIGVNTTMQIGVDERQFNDVLDEVTRVMSSEISRWGGRLVMRKLWTDGTVNAQAYRQGNNFIVEMFGGLARHPDMTADGLALVACHEIGHHIGGAPKYPNAGNTWASNEGQSDYYATAKCLRMLWSNSNNRVDDEDSFARAKCDELWNGDQAESDLCVRSAMAGMASAKLFYNMNGGGRAPAFDTPDLSTVSRTEHSHPAYQCRLDTYFGGALCDKDKNDEMPQNDERTGACTRAEGYEISARPRCWFAPSGGGPVPPGPGPDPGPNPGGDVAESPTLDGQVRKRTNNPYRDILLWWDVRRFPQAQGVYVEVSRPNTPFSNPNGVNPDPNALGNFKVRSTTGGYRLSPIRQLPGWGTYYIRVIPLDGQARPVGRFSESSELTLAPSWRR